MLQPYWITKDSHKTLRLRRELHALGCRFSAEAAQWFATSVPMAEAAEKLLAQFVED